MDWFSLSILCALSLASADAFTKKFFPDYSAWELMLVRFSVPALLLAPLMYFYPLPPVPPIFWVWIAALVPMEILAMLLYMLAIRDSPLHLTLPYLSFTPVFNIVTGWLILDETVSSKGILGIILVVLGAYLLNIEHLKQGARKNWLAPFFAITKLRGARLMLGVAVIYSVTSVAGKGAMQYATAQSFGAFYFCLIGLIVIAYVALTQPRKLRALANKPVHTLLVGAFMAIMVFTHFLALALVEVAYMIAVKRTSMLFGILYGALLFNERNLRNHLTAGISMVCGVALILI